MSNCEFTLAAFTLKINAGNIFKNSAAIQRGYNNKSPPKKLVDSNGKLNCIWICLSEFQMQLK